MNTFNPNQIVRLITTHFKNQFPIYPIENCAEGNYPDYGNEIKVLRVHTSYIGIYINNVHVRREKWLLETTHRDKIVRKINFYLRKGWYQSIYMSVLVKFINPFALSGFFF